MREQRGWAERDCGLDDVSVVECSRPSADRMRPWRRLAGLRDRMRSGGGGRGVLTITNAVGVDH